MALTAKDERLPGVVVGLLAALLTAAVIALLFGIAVGVAAVYIYDRGQSKGDDLAVFLIGMHATLLFVFVSVFSWFRKRQSEITWLTPGVASIAPLTFAVFSTVTMGDSFYFGFEVVGWIVMFFAGLATLLVTRRWIAHPKTWDDDLWTRSRGAGQ
jgi:hypothetical protein